MDAAGRWPLLAVLAVAAVYAAAVPGAQFVLDDDWLLAPGVPDLGTALSPWWSHPRGTFTWRLLAQSVQWAWSWPGIGAGDARARRAHGHRGRGPPGVARAAAWCVRGGGRSARTRLGTPRRGAERRLLQLGVLRRGGGRVRPRRDGSGGLRAPRLARRVRGGDARRAALQGDGGCRRAGGGAGGGGGLLEAHDGRGRGGSGRGGRMDARSPRGHRAERRRGRPRPSHRVDLRPLPRRLAGRRAAAR